MADTGGKFATDIYNTRETGGKFAAGVIDTDGGFATGVVDTGGKLAAVVDEYLREFSKKFKTVLLEFSGAGGRGGELIHQKNQKQKISRHCPFQALAKIVQNFFWGLKRPFMSVQDSSFARPSPKFP
jgi:hypothetical protein